MALALGKLGLVLGAGLLIAREGGISDVSNLVSGALKIVFNQLKQEEPAKSASSPHSDKLLAQVSSLRHEIQLLGSNRPITILSTSESGGRKYGVIIIIGVISYGYVWWKGYRLPDLMFATRRSLTDACNNVGNQIDGFYSSLSGTKRELGSKLDKLDRTLEANTEIIQETGREVTELLDGTANIMVDVRSVFDAVETLASKVYRIEANQDITLKGVGALHAQSQENKRIQESNQALPSTSSVPAIEPAPVTPSSRTLSLPPCETQSPSSPAQQSHGTLQHTHSMSGLKDISESTSTSKSTSKGIYIGEALGNGASGSRPGVLGRFSMSRIVRTASVVNTVPTN